MFILQRVWQSLSQLPKRRLFGRARVNMDSPQPKTRDSCIYLFRGMINVGILEPKTYKVIFYLWSLTANFMVGLYMPFGFLMSFLLRSSAFTPSEFFTSLQLSVNCVGCTLKLFVFMALHKRLVSATKYMDRLDVRIDNDDDRLRIRKSVAFSNRTILMYMSLYLTSSTSSFLLAAVFNGKPPYQLYNPLYEWADSAWKFWFQAFLEYFMLDFHCYQQALMDSYALIFITMIRTHLFILTRRISKLGNDAKMSSDERYEALVQCILDHKNIMKLYNLFSPVISGTMFVQFLVIGLILGIVTIHIVLFANLFATVASLFYAMSILSETFPCSYLANSLADDSDRVSLAIFHSHWPDEEPRYKQVIAFFLQHTQKSMMLTAMKIFPITMNSNINVVKFAFSVYTVVKQMYLGQKENSGEIVP